jgi:hypothetical protein
MGLSSPISRLQLVRMVLTSLLGAILVANPGHLPVAFPSAKLLLLAILHTTLVVLVVQMAPTTPSTTKASVQYTPLAQ